MLSEQQITSMMAAAIQKQDLNRWAASNDIATARSENA